ncbi:hypothetical protein O3M35_009635 [Rhynocoris fuscipes]|uniref:MSP domain-containing protein n=1 Tax=Rhynocoris fuscipes TaxID=488301 RepID=A0AAW1D4H2_9HEMI
MQPGSALDGNVPVFAFPSSLDFYLGSQTTYKRVITLYNPYDFAVRFSVHCNARDKYIVVYPEGSIKSKCQVDLVIRHKAVTPANCNVVDKFKIKFHDHTTKQEIGRKVITAKLHPGVPESEDDDKSITSATSLDLNERSISNLKFSSQSFGTKDGHSSSGRGGNSVNPVVLLTGLVCVIALLLPNEGDQNTSFPLHLSHNLKLVFSYVLGLVTIVIFRS